VPTYEWLPVFERDLARLTREQRAAFATAVEALVSDLRMGKGVRPGLRVKGVQGAQGVFELTWAADGRATFQFGKPIHGTDPHVIWRRIGTHDIFKRP
jgi:hypothetical protein